MSPWVHYSVEGAAFFCTRSPKDKPAFWLSTNWTPGDVSDAMRQMRPEQTFAQSERPDGSRYYREVHFGNRAFRVGETKPIDPLSDEYKDYAVLNGWPC